MFINILYSQDSTTIIRSIKFEGLKRTKIVQWVNILKPIESVSVYTSATTNDIAQKLYSEHIFQPNITFDVVEEGNYVDITVYVKDKWTLIPLPNVAFSDSFWIVGLVLYEENLFGLNNKLEAMDLLAGPQVLYIKIKYFFCKT